MTFQIAIADDEAWNREILETTGLLQGRSMASFRMIDFFLVVECYKDWCGSCKAIVSAFRRISLDLGDSPLKFYIVEYQSDGF